MKKNRRNENENNHEIESKQYCQKRLNRYTKTNDAKSKDVLNRLRFMKFETLKKHFFSKEVFFSKCELAKTWLLVLIEISDCLIEISARTYLSSRKKSSKMCLYSKKSVFIFEEKCAIIQRNVFVSTFLNDISTYLRHAIYCSLSTTFSISILTLNWLKQIQ
jgi:hypothetical protein